VASIPAPQVVEAWVTAVPSLVTRAFVSRVIAAVACARTIRGSPRIAATAANSTPRRSSSATANGSIAHGRSQWPVAGVTGASGRAPADGCVSATPRARRRAASVPAGLTSRVAAKPHAPPTSTRMPTPSLSWASTASMSSSWTASASARWCTCRASA
jgi:hypothetical protein